MLHTNEVSREGSLARLVLCQVEGLPWRSLGMHHHAFVGSSHVANSDVPVMILTLRHRGQKVVQPPNLRAFRCERTANREPASDTQVVFRDSAFANDIAKTNMTAILEQHGIAHVRSL